MNSTLYKRLLEEFSKNSIDLYSSLYVIIQNSPYVDIKWETERKKFYSVKEYLNTLIYLYNSVKIKENDIAVILNVIEYYGDNIAFKHIVSHYDFKGSNNIRLVMDIAKVYKNFGFFRDADTFYKILGDLSKSKKKLTYYLLLYAKFTNDYFLREGIYTELIKISFARLNNKTKQNLTQRNKDIIIHSLFKLSSDKNHLKLHSEIDISYPSRISFALLRKELLECNETSKGLRTSERINHLIEYLKDSGNSMAYYVRKLEHINLCMISPIHDKTKIDNYDIQLFETNINTFSLRYNKVKLFNRAQNVFSKLILQSRREVNYKEIFTRIQTIKEINNLPNNYVQKPNDLLESLTNYRKLSIQNSYMDLAQEIEQIIADQLQILYRALNNDFNSLYKNDNSPRQNSLGIVLSILSKKEIDDVKRAMNFDLINLGTKFYNSMKRLTSLNRWNLENERLSIFNDFIRFNNHEFAEHINSIQLESNRINNNMIQKECKILTQLLVNSYKRKFNIQKEIINVHDQIDFIIGEFSNIFGTKIQINNLVEKNFKCLTIKLLIDFTLNNLFKNANEQENLVDYPISISLSVNQENDMVDLIYQDNIIDNSDFEKSFLKENVKTQTIKTRGNGLKFIRDFVKRFCVNKEISYSLNSDGKSLRIPLSLKI